MIVSMTGYGRYKTQTDTMTVTVEMKSVNHRFCEIAVRIPRQFIMFEDKMKRIVKKHVQRGRVDIFVTIEGSSVTTKSLEVDWALAEQFHTALRETKKKFELDGDVSIDQFVHYPDLFIVNETEDDIAQLEDIFLETTQAAAEQLTSMRQKEGYSLADDISERLLTINNIVTNLFTYANQVEVKYREKLLRKVTEFTTGTIEMDEGRILTEVALFADRADISEELTRLRSHIGQFQQSLKSDSSVGRKLDFLCQEMNREMNTIGAKANDVTISQQVVELKSTLEKIKEQVQNIE
ncbi:YicC/YloC family endoribonuclease [Bacillus solimangrovi]|uniref:YicC family protein n=1 Tax=Bacillus solimangrovi TaxID=1305675 RepID=A0A1E5LB39_9BACI|nr:YicC/YloC family endoribonuclease [Bacillus solimangrovi]OEH91293.1 YicC family protein [Bacillus solimangrovi]